MYNSISQAIGSTPLIAVSRFCAHYSCVSEIAVKVEFTNPCGSIKDRAALGMLDDAEKRGVIGPGATIIEPTSGNTGIALAAIGASRGYRVIITMPDSMSIERRKLIAAYGAEVVLTPAAGGMKAAIEKAESIAAATENSFIPSQFTNPANPEMHYNTTGPEIYEQCDGKIDFFVAGIGSGGTISGIARYLKEKNPNIKIVGVEPFDSPYLTEKRAGAHKIQGIGAGFVPQNLDVSLLDDVMTAKTEESFDASRTLARTEGLLAGISSGAALACALRLSASQGSKDSRIVVMLPDTGDRYLSSGLYD